MINHQNELKSAAKGRLIIKIRSRKKRRRDTEKVKSVQINARVFVQEKSELVKIQDDFNAKIQWDYNMNNIEEAFKWNKAVWINQLIELNHCKWASEKNPNERRA